MRTIKFRAWDRDIEKMRPFAFISTVRGSEPETLDDAIDIAGQSQVLMQYTGLKDKDGKEIYEGDIVRKDGEYNGLVEYVFSGFRLSIWYEKDEWQPFTDRWTEYGEVIGNIYENPELLTQ